MKKTNYHTHENAVCTPGTDADYVKAALDAGLGRSRLQ